MDEASTTDNEDLENEISEGEAEEDAADGDFDESFQIDFDYEYDAPKFFDFARYESSSEVEDAEEWYRHAGSDPPSPFILKLKWSIDELLDGEPSSHPDSAECSTTYSESAEATDHTVLQDSIMTSESSTVRHNSKALSSSKSSLSRNSNLLKPTISHLAKQNLPVSARSSGSFGSHWVNQNQTTSVRSSGSSVRYQIPRSSRNKSLEIDATKRQKLEKGYLNKVARLKHQSLFAHKPPKLARPESKYKATVPKEPALETTQRAQQRRPKILPHTEGTPRVQHEAFKAQPLNKKIFEAPSLPPPKKKQIPTLMEFKEFNFRTSQRATKLSAQKCTTSKVPTAEETHNMQRPKPGTRSSMVDKCNKACGRQACPTSKKVPGARKGGSGVVMRKTKIIPKEINMGPGNVQELFSKLSLNSEGTAVTTTENKRVTVSTT